MSNLAKTSGRIQQWLHRDEWSWVLDHVFQKHVGEVCAEHGVAPSKLPEMLGDSGMFMLSNFLTECALTEPVSPSGDDPFADPDAPDSEPQFDLDLDADDDDLTTVIDDYLARRGYRESATAKRYLQALRDTPVSVFEVTAVNPGRNVTVRDLLMAGEPVTVGEKSGSKSLNVWDCIAARLVEVNGRPAFTGSLLALTRDVADTVTEEMSAMREEFAERIEREEMSDEDRALAGPMLDVLVMMQSAEVVSYLWLDHYLRQATGKARVYVNTDGDELAFSFASFVINPGKHEQVAAALDSVEAFERADDGGEDVRAFWNWLADENDGGSADIPENALIIQTTLIGSRAVMGNIELEGDTLEVSGNSPNRRDRLATLVADTLAGLVGEARYSDRAVLDSSSTGQEIDPAIQAEIMAQYFDEHYRNLLDDEIPALGGQTPRQHVKTAQGRKAVIAWLKEHENSLARQGTASGGPAYDISWVWDELGLDRAKA
jgi:hypothetical protein